MDLRHRQSRVREQIISTARLDGNLENVDEKYKICIEDVLASENQQYILTRSERAALDLELQYYENEDDLCEEVYDEE